MWTWLLRAGAMSAVALAAVVVGPEPAAAGGSWLSPVRDRYGPGDTVTLVGYVGPGGTLGLVEETGGEESPSAKPFDHPGEALSELLEHRDVADTVIVLQASDVIDQGFGGPDHHERALEHSLWRQPERARHVLAVPARSSVMTTACTST